MKKDTTIDKERRVPCMECNTDTYHKVLSSTNLFDQGDWGVFWQDYEIIMCQGCRSVSFRKSWGTDDVIGQDDEGDFIYDESEELFPSRVKGRKEIKHHSQLPLNVGRIYRETYRAITGKQPILSGMGIRALVEAVCVDQKIKGRDLKAKINNLVVVGLLTKDGAEILHPIRLYGNDAAHKTFQAKDEDLSILMDIAENLLQNTYIITKKV
jgi:hypothetical protein